MNQQSIDLTIASFCIVNQSWHCFAELINAIGTQAALESLVSPSLDQGRGKRPSNYAEETDQMQEFEQVLAWFENFPSKDNQPVALQHQVSGHLSLDQILDTIMQGRIATQSTLLITDYRCLEHADFINGHHLGQRIRQREHQPENSDRLRVLVDKQKGVFNHSREFVENKYSSLVY